MAAQAAITRCCSFAISISAFMTSGVMNSLKVGSVKNLSHFLKIQMARQSVKVFVHQRTSDRRATPCLLPKPPQQKKTPVIQINQEVLHNNLSGYVRKNLENILNELPDAEADRLCHAKRYERNAERASR